MQALYSLMLLLLWVALIASSFVVSEHLLPYANPVASTALRFILASLLMAPLVIPRYPAFPSREMLFKYFVITLFLVLFFLGLFQSLKTTTATRTSVIYTLVPLMTVFISYISLRATTKRRQLIGFILGTLGATWVLLTLGKDPVNLLEWYTGDTLFLLSCVSITIHIVLIKRWITHHHPLQSSFYILSFGAVMLLPILAIFGELDTLDWHQIGFWKSFLYLTLFTTIGTFLLQQHIIQKLGPNTLLAFSYLVPAFVLIPSVNTPHKLLNYAVPGLLLTGLSLYLIISVPKRRVAL